MENDCEIIMLIAFISAEKNTLMLKVHSEEQIRKSLSAKSGSRDDYEYVSIASGGETIELQSVPPGQPGLPVQQVFSRPPDQPVPPVPSSPPDQPVSLIPSGPLAPVAENEYESIDYDSSTEEMKTAESY